MTLFPSDNLVFDTALPYAGGCILLAFGLLVRLRPFRINPKLGVDNWYWLLCAEDARRRRRLPARLPYFMLEPDEQWYPPLYAGILALFPTGLLERHGGKVSQIIDMLHCLLIYVGVLAVAKNVPLALLAGLSYAVAYTPMIWNTQLQPRGLGNLMLTLAVGGLWFYSQTHSPLVWAGVVGLSTAILFLHKMTTQMWLVYVFGFGLWARDWTIPALLPACVVCAVVVSKGFYVKVLRAHWDIVSFWHENIRFLGSHQYYESTRYGKDDFVSTALHQPTLRGFVSKCRTLFQCQVFVLLLPVLAAGTALSSAPRSGGGVEGFLWWWLGLTLMWCLLTTFVPYFTALGAGVLYLYQSFFPLFVLAGLMVQRVPAPALVCLFVAWCGAMYLSMRQYARYLKSLASSQGDGLSEDLGKVLDHLKGLPNDGVFCIPFTLPDVTAYRTRKKVFWGGHGYGFRTMLDPYFPIMREDVVQTLTHRPLSYVLCQRDYLESLDDIGLEEGRTVRPIYGRGGYELYEVIK